jgi:hypothetical protein
MEKNTHIPKYSDRSILPTVSLIIIDDIREAIFLFHASAEKYDISLMIEKCL